MDIGSNIFLVGTTELRQSMPKIMKQIKEKKVILINRGKPFAVITDFEEHQRNEKILEALDDQIAGNIALERLKNSSDDDFMDAEEFAKKHNL